MLSRQAEKIIMYIDGGSRGNPGPAASAYVITDLKGKQLEAKGFFLGEATNNAAEYTGLIRGLDAAKRLGAAGVEVLSDSELLVRQINGQYKVKSETIREFFEQAMGQLLEFKSWQVRHIVREKNKKADALVNKVLDYKRDVEEKTKSPKVVKPIRLGVLISGGGTTLMNLVKLIEQGELNAEIPLVISSSSIAGGVAKAKAAGLNVKVIRRKDFPDITAFSKKLEEELAAAKVELVIQGGWLCLWEIPSRYVDKVMNIHPALLPGFGGKGMWGHHVHQAVLDYGCKVSGCTVHFCTNEYDKGPIIVQRCCEVKEDDDADTLAKRVFEEECIAYPEAIKLFAVGRVTVKGNKAVIK